MSATGAPHTEINIVDYSVLLNTALKGKTGWLGVTERGEPGKLYDIASEEEYKLKLGNLLPNNNFPLLCLRVLNNGGRIVVCPAGKYLNPTQKSSLDGVKASYTNTQVVTAAAGAVGTIVFSASATGTGTVDVIVKRPGMSDVIIASAVAITTADTVTAQGTALAAGINSGTGTHGYSAVNTAGSVAITAPTALGAWGRNLKLNAITSTGITLNDYAPSFAGGNDALVAATAAFTAKAKGVAYNKVKVTPTFAASNDPAKVDIVVSITDGTVPDETYRDVPKLGNDAGMATKITEIINKSDLLSNMVISSGFVFQPFSQLLTGGTDGAALIPNDYMGDQSQLTNLRAFDVNAEITKICVPDVADGTLAKSIADYVDMRKDLMGLHRTPLGLSPDRVLEYRLGTGSYSHVPINSWRNLMFTGGINVIDPLTLQNKDIPEIGDVAGIIAKKDNAVGEWFSFAGDKRGMLSNVNGVVVNVGTGALAGKADDYQKNGIIPVIQDADKNIKIFGNPTLYKTSSLLQKAEVAELMVFVYRSLRSIVPYTTFDPNDTQSWGEIYRRVVPFIKFLITGRALWNKENEEDLWYKGDQHVVDPAKAVINTPSTIDNGEYRFKLYLKPKTALLYTIVTVAVTNSGVDFKSIEQGGL